VAEKIVGTDTTKYSFDALSELRSVRLPNGTVISYLYDGNGRRVGKRVNGAFVQGFLYSGNLHPIAELDASGAVIRQFVYASRQDVPDFLIQGGITYRIVADAAGSVRLVVDSQTGAIAQRIDYDAFGRVISNSAPGFQPLGFGGGFSDTETGLVHLGLRFYDPETGRWISRDPILFDGGSSNLYTYAGSDPVNRADRTGTFIGALITEMAMDETIEESQHTKEIERLKTVLNVAAACVNGYVDAWSKKTGMDYEHGGQNCHKGVISELFWDVVETKIGFEKHSPAWQIAYSCMFGAFSDAYVPMVMAKSDDHAGVELAMACIGGGAGQGLEYVNYSHHPIIGPIVGALAKVMFHVSEKFAEALDKYSIEAGGPLAGCSLKHSKKRTDRSPRW
jgi:RHS repeat-associated protein